MRTVDLEATLDYQVQPIKVAHMHFFKVSEGTGGNIVLLISPVPSVTFYMITHRT